MRDDDDGSLPPELSDAVSQLREEPEIRSEWLASVLDAAATQRIDDINDTEPATVGRRWSFRPSVAIAAALAFAVAGAGVARVMSRDQIGPRETRGVPVVSAAAESATTRFALVAPGAVTVTLVGDFNGWNPTALPMRRSSSGETWEVEVRLAPGRYTYSFVVDGRLARDPSAAEAARDDFGIPTSVLLVKGGGT
jgi:hypothetical protein